MCRCNESTVATPGSEFCPIPVADSDNDSFHSPKSTDSEKENRVSGSGKDKGKGRAEPLVMNAFFTRSALVPIEESVDRAEDPPAPKAVSPAPLPVPNPCPLMVPPPKVRQRCIPRDPVKLRAAHARKQGSWRRQPGERSPQFRVVTESLRRLNRQTRAHIIAAGRTPPSDYESIFDSGDETDVEDDLRDVERVGRDEFVEDSEFEFVEGRASVPWSRSGLDA